MSTPEQIRAEIDATRAELSSDVDALTDKVTPSKIAHRQTEKVKGKLTSVKESIMGVASDAKDNVSSGISSGAGSIGDAASNIADAPHKVAEKARGNALAVGLIAFGVGALVSSLIPASEKEKAAASSIKDAAEPLVEQVTDAAKEVASHLKEPAQDAAAAVKEQAVDSVDTVKSEAGSAGSELKDQAKDAKDTVVAS
jgi:gas vesicle protein